MTTESGEPTAGEGEVRPSAAAAPLAPDTTSDGHLPERAEPPTHGARHRASDLAGKREQEPAPDAAPDAVAAEDAGAAPDDDGAWTAEPDDAASPASPTRRNAVILRYLLGRLAIDHVRRLTVWAPAVPLAGAVLLLVRPRWIGAAVLALGVLLVAVRIAAVRFLRRRSLPDRYRPVETELRDAVESGKANLRVELRRTGLPSRSWQVPLYALRLARGSSRAQARARMRAVDVDLVLPRAQLDRAVRVLDQAGGQPAGG